MEDNNFAIILYNLLMRLIDLNSEKHLGDLFLGISIINEELIPLGSFPR
jgi:hypothetical protein